MTTRRGFKQQLTLQDRIVAWIKEVRAEAAGMAPGPDRDMLLDKVRQAETVMHLENWLNSPGLQQPK
jgi:hypothetical protein